MSQFFINSASIPPPPIVPTEFITDDGTVIPALNIVNVNGVDSTENDDQGILTRANPDLSNNLEIILTNRVRGTVTTTNATLTTLVTFNLGATPGMYNITGVISAFAPALNDGATYDFDSGVKTTGVVGTEVGTEFSSEFEDVTFATADIFTNVSGNNLLIQVQGVVGVTINWKCKFEFEVVN